MEIVASTGNLSLSTPLRAADFFAGIGLAQIGMERAGLSVVWSNDISKIKHAMHSRHFGSNGEHRYVVKDLGLLQSAEYPTEPLDLAWASFPCTDLSVAGNRAGLHRGVASSTFWHFIKVLARLRDSRPPVVVLENVTAFATHRSGQDITSAIRALNGLGYSVDVLKIDAAHFVPQSRPRLFVVAVQGEMDSRGQTSAIRPEWLNSIFSDSTLRTHRLELPDPPEFSTSGLEQYVDLRQTEGPTWWPHEQVSAYVRSLSPLQLKRFELLQGDTTRLHVRTAFRRMRDRQPRWEMRRDGLAGCLRTSSGGSSKQALVVLGDNQANIRWLLPAEYAALMGAPEYAISGVIAHHGYSGFGDGVCAPVVTWLMENYVKPVLCSGTRLRARKAELDVGLLA